MTKKMQLPDEILDAVSGGKLAYGGEAVTGFDVEDQDGKIIVTMTTASGDFRGEAEKSLFLSSADAWKGSLEATDKSEHIYDLKGMFKPLD